MTLLYSYSYEYSLFDFIGVCSSLCNFIKDVCNSFVYFYQSVFNNFSPEVVDSWASSIFQEFYNMNS